MVWKFIAVKTRYLKPSAVLKFTKTQNEPKLAETKKCNPQTSNNDSRPIFRYHVHNQVDFDNPFVNGRRFIYLGISKMSLTF